MKPVDKYGRPIYPRIYSIIVRYGEKLESIGWFENRNKPNLFSKNYFGFWIYADMRSTEVIPIWEDPKPIIYWFQKDEADWEFCRAIRHAVQDLDYVGVPHRFSFYEDSEPDGLMHGEDEERPDGLCKMCHNEMDHDGLFCSKKCEKAHQDLVKLKEEKWRKEFKCRICGKPLTWKTSVEHHIDYEKEKTIGLCRACHTSLHQHNEEYPELAPSKPKYQFIIPKPNKDLVGNCTCAQCGANFSSENTYEIHWIANHKTGRKRGKEGTKES
jgi:transcription elongation factor Elf1